MTRVSERARGRLMVGGGLLLVVILASGVVLSELGKRRADAEKQDVISVETKDVEEQGSTAEDILSGFERGQVLTKPQAVARPTRQVDAAGEPVFVLADQTDGAGVAVSEPDPFWSHKMRSTSYARASWWTITSSAAICG